MGESMANHNNKNKQQLIAELQQALQRNEELQAGLHSGVDMSHLSQEGFLQTMMAALPHTIFLVDVQDYMVRKAKTPGSSAETPVGTPCYRAAYHREIPCAGPECPCVLQAAVETKKMVMRQHHGKPGTFSATWSVP